MKRTAILLSVFSLIIISCKEIKKENPTEAETTVKMVEHDSHTRATQEPDDTWENDMVLNNGIKWQANKETTDGVRAMLSLINGTKASTIDDYKELGDKLNDVKNTVVEECTMKGPSHDNLHIWLYPLIKKIELLQNAETTKEGAETLASIIDNLNAYNTYFK
ncbi:hypothetical protein SAMN05421636_105141 [Pricia antarctica]|uniref:Lipoprotein n=1 Tax=Pricia antarctica TaxID=641691 RepID=A0A1G7D240_9FLAO|nr:hypothetical protein [Pricia antarctica]SDE45662.1 hypothetical protein SAMN05421636_105141 [Pricia antarctica]